MEILYKDNYLIIINKVQNLMVEPDAHGHPNLQDEVHAYLEKNGAKKIFLQPVHRIDRPVSGIVLFALKPSALKNLNRQFAERTVQKNYLAITQQKPTKSKGRLSHYLLKDEFHKKAIIADHEKLGYQKVELEYEISNSKNNFYLWKIKLITGKYHQVRAQLAHCGCPICGDEKYGSSFSYKPNAIALHAASLDFNHPFTNEPICIKATCPDDELWHLLD